MNQGRHLGASEQYFWLSDQRQPKHFVVTADVDGATRTEEWRKAFDLLQQRHPLLRMSISANEDGKPRFSESQKRVIPLQTLPLAGNTDWERHVAEELKSPFEPGTEPLVRGRLLHGSERSVLLLVLHHAIADGLSGAYLIRDLLVALSTGKLPESELPEAQESYLASLELGEVEAPAGNADQPAWSPSKNQDRTATGLKVQSLRLPQSLTSAIRSKSRIERTTVHGTLVAALTLAGHQLSEQWRGLPIRVVSPVNNRALLGLKDDCVVSIVFPVGAYENRSMNNFWSTARKVNADIAPVRNQEGLKRVFDATEGMVKANHDPMAIEAVERIACACEMMASNMGVLPFGENFGSLRLTSLWGPSVLVGIEGEQNIGVVTVNNQIHLLQTSFNPIDGFLGRVREILSAVVED